MAKFGDTERKIQLLFLKGTQFNYEGNKYKVLESGKPVPSDGKGEPKTDLYIKAQASTGDIKEFKISIKQDNADFLENKTSLERATEILGDDAQKKISTAIQSIEDKFKHPLVYIEKSGKTEAGCITIGWKFELMNVLSGAKSGKMPLSDDEKIDVYSGTNLSTAKRDSKVNGNLIPESGIANYILVIPDSYDSDAQSTINKIQDIETYATSNDIFFACKAINYRTSKDKWDGNRPLAVFVKWEISDSLINHEIIFDEPLSIKANEIGEKIRAILNAVNIDKNNFRTIKELIKDQSIVND